MYVSMSLPSDPEVHMPSVQEVLAMEVEVAPSTVTLYMVFGVRSPTVNMVVVATDEEAVHCLLEPQVIFDIFSHSGRVVEAS